ncbi:MAG: UDP-N-acetylglucosamine 2-epimerase (non-hydrolyzing) [Candidatus Cloacimonetes bacterium]|nr:UDP-N-acetylglucosamine 2-epimerase (non-hydrolyzing) [Candidatus Cloacimonadota bacterium]
MNEVKKKIHLVVGARPNFMKMAPLYREFSKYPAEFEVKLIHTGQHYDERMSDFFFNDLGLPKPDIYLGVGSGTHGEQTARIMERYEQSLLEDKPDIVIVAGDVNSTAACAIDAVKLHIPVAHLEAGLRSWDRTMPEEINRLLTDSIAEWLLTPSIDANINLQNEGIPAEKIHLVGNIMIDSLCEFKDKAKASEILERLKIRAGEYCLITLHRPGNVDNFAGLDTIISAFSQIAEKIKLVFPIHPRTRKQLTAFGLDDKVAAIKNLLLIEPAGYYDFIKLQMESRFIITDSGGVQEESTWFQIPCLTLRPNTERPITITEGTNQLIKLEAKDIVTAAEKILAGETRQGKIPDNWDGKTAQRVAAIFRD